MSAIIIAFIASIVVVIALYFTNVICSLGIGNACESSGTAPSSPREPSAGTGCLGRLYQQCTTNNECPIGKKCESITVNFSNMMVCI
jgi:hypothetical protein